MRIIHGQQVDFQVALCGLQAPRGPSGAARLGKSMTWYALSALTLKSKIAPGSGAK
jgi:hypothetical protein